jgi:hypothetical protein
MNELPTVEITVAPSDRARIVCREIKANDIPELIALLQIGFPERSAMTWRWAFRRLHDHPTPTSYPKYGYLLENQDGIVGVQLTIFTTITTIDDREVIRCNLSSWYVTPLYRSYAAMLTARAVRRREVTYLNISPHPGTLALIEAQGYQRYCNGVFFCLPALKLSGRGKVKPFTHPIAEFTRFENRLLSDHRAYGCIGAICSVGDRKYPFVFTAGYSGRVRAIHLAYCRSIEDFVRCAGSLGRFLIGCGHPLVIIDADQPIPGLVGKFYDHWPKFFKGPYKPAHIAYTERPLFGI